MPTLSFVVPVYNVSPFLGRCLDSIINQTYTSFEIVAVDDGSTDNSADILAQYEEKYPDFIRVFRKENGGLSDARNYGLERARGRYIAFVDSDDFIHPTFAEKTVQKMEEEGLDLLFFDFYYHYDQKDDVYVSSRKHFSNNMAKEALVSPPMAWMRLYKRELLSQAPFQKGIFYEDLEMTPGMILTCPCIGHLPEALYYYYQREGSIMSQAVFSPKLLDIFSVCDSIYQRFSQAGRLEEYRDEIEYLYLEHLFRSAALRFASLPERKELFQRLRNTVEEKFPHWRKNPLLPKTSLFFRLTVFCTGRGLIGAVGFLKKMKG